MLTHDFETIRKKTRELPRQLPELQECERLEKNERARTDDQRSLYEPLFKEIHEYRSCRSSYGSALAEHENTLSELRSAGTLTPQDKQIFASKIEYELGTITRSCNEAAIALKNLDRASQKLVDVSGTAETPSAQSAEIHQAKTSLDDALGTCREIDNVSQSSRLLETGSTASMNEIRGIETAASRTLYDLPRKFPLLDDAHLQREYSESRESLERFMDHLGGKLPEDIKTLDEARKLTRRMVDAFRKCDAEAWGEAGSEKTPHDKLTVADAAMEDSAAKHRRGFAGIIDGLLKSPTPRLDALRSEEREKFFHDFVDKYRGEVAQRARDHGTPSPHLTSPYAPKPDGHSPPRSGRSTSLR